VAAIFVACSLRKKIVPSVRVRATGGSGKRDAPAAESRQAPFSHSTRFPIPAPDKKHRWLRWLAIGAFGAWLVCLAALAWLTYVR
jgi:hypothetical protein